ncbi:MAG: hypothetical protein Tsb007_26200 [Rhizobacter sp.]
MNCIARCFNRSTLACLWLALAACGGGGDSGGTPPPAGGAPPPASAVIGAAGGTVTAAHGASIVIPPGALATDTTIAIEQSSAGAPPLPGGFVAAGETFALTPHGTTFAVPVTITLPFDPAALQAGVAPALYKTNAQNQWELVAGASFGASLVTAQITSFSYARPAAATVERRDPIRQWTFTPSEQPIETGPLNARGELLDLGGEQHERRFHGLNNFLTFDGDITRTLETFSSADGVTFWVSAEDVGGAELRQSQKFVKRTANASLQFVITRGLLEAVDGNQVPTTTECPRGLGLSECSPLNAFIAFSAEARSMLGELVPDAQGQPALDAGGYISLHGRADLWDFFVGAHTGHSKTIWSLGHFETTKNLGGGFGERHSRALLRSPLVLNVDLSRVALNGEFRVITTLRSHALNTRGRESAIGAYLRDPSSVEGTQLSFDGLERVPDPESANPAPPVPLAPAPCNGGPDPSAGVLQFSAATYTFVEAPFAGLNARGVLVTRTGGSTGSVSVNVSSGGGTATPGVQYAPVNTTLHFGDGDADARLVDLGIVPIGTTGPDVTVNLVLASPGGCAALGPQAAAVVTILDAERSPPPPPPSGLDISFGTAGKASAPAFGGDRSAMALQADGKTVMVGGTFTDFVLARFNADGTLDASFGVDGKVTTDMGSGLRTEEALGVAIQADGKIVVVGYTAIPNTPPAPALPATFALARYNNNGSLDTTFGTGGRVSGNVNGNAHAVAIQADGKIVVVGEFASGATTDSSDFTVARFNPDGTLDMPFGTSGTGQFVTDFGQAPNGARNVVIEPDGAIVVSGSVTGSATQTDIARYLPNGTLDSRFGSGGKLTLAGTLVGEGLVRQPDGKFVLVGGETTASVPASARFVLMRLNPDGSPDASFGNAGRVDAALSEHATAKGVALQADGKIVAVGTRALSANTNFIVARYGTNGDLDTGFGLAGTLSVDFFGSTDIGENVLVQPDGKILVGGQARNNVDGYGIARINP